LRLSELIEGNGAAAEIEVVGLSADSREVRPGYLFAALSGSQVDGVAFIDDAIEHGAVAVLARPGTRMARSAVRLVLDDNPRRRLARMAARFHGRQPPTVVAVTGTNGKTSVVSFTRQIWSALGHAAASFGTLGIEADNFSLPVPHTTPEPIELHRLLAEITERGIDHLAIEASSHGLDQCRLDGVDIGAAAFTNLSRDHLDYHVDGDAYYHAKERLFSEVMRRGVAVLNADDDCFAELATTTRACGHRLIGYGRAGTGIRLVDVHVAGQGQDLEIDVLGRRQRVRLPLIGAFQVSNALCALGLVLAGGASATEATAAIEGLKGARGRLELVARHGSGAPIYVDYAHTPDALANVLAAVRPHVGGRLWVVFGCGGDRDQGKRPEMGAVAARYANRIIVTDDNPRGEDAAAIRRAVLAACPAASEIGPREEAIAAAIEGLCAEDVLVVAGKGHEEGQTIGDEVRPFDDGAVIRAALGGALGGAP
jgi:UDP-N-acetylmuramoyl-L-alanyl-D-glutamate--2,6-diaminopimelate ligase